MDTTSADKNKNKKTQAWNQKKTFLPQKSRSWMTQLPLPLPKRAAYSINTQAWHPRTCITLSYKELTTEWITLSQNTPSRSLSLVEAYKILTSGIVEEPIKTKKQDLYTMRRCSSKLHTIGKCPDSSGKKKKKKENIQKWKNCMNKTRL